MFACSAGCAGAQVTKLSQKVNDLTDEVSELRRGQAAQRVQFDEFRNRLVMLQDKLDSARVQQARVSPPMRDEAPPVLPHVVLPATAAQHVTEARAARGGYGGRAEQGAHPQVHTSEASANRSVVIGPDGIIRVSQAAGSGSSPQESRQPSKTSAGRAKAKTKNHNARGHVPAGPGDRPNSAPPQNQSPDERAAGEYRAAKAQLDAGQLRGARDEFTAFLRDHPNHPLADNALYWMGETWYGQSLWLRSARVFGQVVERYPQGNKVPDAMLKTGLCYLNLGEQKLARDTFEQLISMYPGTPTARIARKKLAKLESGS